MDSQSKVQAARCHAMRKRESKESRFSRSINLDFKRGVSGHFIVDERPIGSGESSIPSDPIYIRIFDGRVFPRRPVCR